MYKYIYSRLYREFRCDGGEMGESFHDMDIVNFICEMRMVFACSMIHDELFGI